MSKRDYFEITVAKVVQETDDAVSVAFDIPADLAEFFSYRPGQFVTLRLPVEGKLRHRCYSLCSAPGLDTYPTIAIKRVEGGLVSNLICSSLRAGQKVAVQPPAGLFTPANLDADFLLMAGGSGITPVLSILKAALAGGTGRIVLVYANRDEASVIFRDEISRLLHAHPDRLIVHHWLESLQGLPTEAHLAALARGNADAHVFICGPEKFMAAAAEAAHIAGVPRDHVHVEKFVSLPDEEEPGEALEFSGGPAENVELTVSIDGAEHRLEWRQGEKLLDTMLHAGIDAPYSCRVGGCSACMCRVVEGDVRMARNEILSEEETAEGWTLACQALPTSGKVRVDIP